MGFFGALWFAPRQKYAVMFKVLKDMDMNPGEIYTTTRPDGRFTVKRNTPISDRTGDPTFDELSKEPLDNSKLAQFMSGMAFYGLLYIFQAHKNVSARNCA